MCLFLFRYYNLRLILPYSYISHIIVTVFLKKIENKQKRTQALFWSEFFLPPVTVVPGFVILMIFPSSSLFFVQYALCYKNSSK